MPATDQRAPRRRLVPLAPEGLPFIAIGVGLAIVGALFSWVAFAVLLVVAGLVGAFFRDPDREVPQGQGLVVSPADGKVVLIENTPEGHYAGAGRTQVSIFLSILDVHVNRAPVAGTVSGVDYRSGSFLPAFNDKASLRNEQNRVVLEHGAGQVGVTQIAGIIARRIVFRPTVGDHVERGERFGLIRFGSRLDVFLPTGTTVHATVGDKVRGGTSVLADLRGADSRPEGRQP
ncbi:MAG: phosphatidylserine decarboxylase family protein [Acidimicrobiales bacterium]